MNSTASDFDEFTAAVSQCSAYSSPVAAESERRLRNRIHSQISRERKRLKLLHLESKVAELLNHNVILASRVKELQQENTRLTERLRMSRSDSPRSSESRSSTSDEHPDALSTTTDYSAEDLGHRELFGKLGLVEGWEFESKFITQGGLEQTMENYPLVPLDPQLDREW